MFGNGACFQDPELLVTTTTGQEAEAGGALVSTDCGHHRNRLGQLTFRIYVKEKKSVLLTPLLGFLFFFLSLIAKPNPK